MPGRHRGLFTVLLAVGVVGGLPQASAEPAHRENGRPSDPELRRCDDPAQRGNGPEHCARGRAAPRPTGVNGAIALRNGQPPTRITGAYRVIETTPDTVARNVVIDGLVGDDLQRGGIRLRGHLTNITIRNSEFRFRREPQVAPHLPACLEIGDKGDSRIEGLLIQNVTCEGFQMTREPNKYWNGDGPAIESNVSGVVIDNLVSRNSTDGCADIKPIFRATRMVLGGCKLQLRAWRGGEVDELQIETPIRRGGRGAVGGIWLRGNALEPPSLHIHKLIVRFSSSSPIFVVAEGPANIRVDECDIQAPAGTPWTTATHPMMRWDLGPSCTAFASPRQVVP